jgi:5-formyltetrahydrofolate cyclo-ligase
MNDDNLQKIRNIQQRKSALRKELRAKRCNLSPQQQLRAARDLYKSVANSLPFLRAKRIAFTLANDGEIDTSLLLQEAFRRGKACYLPVMSRLGENRLSFHRWIPTVTLKKACYGILEPMLSARCPPRCLSLVLVPLVGFDDQCNRLGMGKAFYDRTFNFLWRSPVRRPQLLGLAHECQKVNQLEVTSWDLPLDGIVTDKAWYTPT